MSGFDWSHYYNLALELAGEASGPICEEAKQRCSISRAYYAVFVPTRDRLEQLLNIRFDRSKVHTAVREELSSSTDSDWNNLASLLDTMSEHRKNADYDAQLKNRPDMIVKLQLKAAEKALELIPSLR